ncbi:class I SAM-dependent methyltransferase [soil metagenome]
MNNRDPKAGLRPAGGKGGAVQRQYASQASDYERRWAGYLDATLKTTLAALHARAAERILDVGCGTGLLLRELQIMEPGVEGYGVDVSEEMLVIAADRSPGARHVRADVHQLPFRGRSFDAVVSSSSLHHWARPSQVLTGIRKLLRPGGRLVLTDWADDFLPTRVLSLILRVTDRSHVRTFTSAELCAMLEQTGFDVQRIQLYRFGWKWGFTTISAKLNRPAS